MARLHGFPDWGRSPRVRGSQTVSRVAAKDVGSIPACAGEPTPARAAVNSSGVDPRVCGGALRSSAIHPRTRGRSPRVRGSLRRLRRPGGRVGSIPACAGEPANLLGCARHLRVDPRVCGGADLVHKLPADREGRSPRVRGSPATRWRSSCTSGSIPACAGEPGGRSPRGPGDGVDPRVCGGAASTAAKGMGPMGRSPRVRGSHHDRGRAGGLAGSIPACAGEPCRRVATPAALRVDPRVCGGAATAATAPWISRGRSPRVRGSRDSRSRSVPRRGSIPACAGEPPMRG